MKLQKIAEVRSALIELNQALLIEVTVNNAREQVASRMGRLYKALEELEAEMDLTAEEIFGEQIETIQTQEKGA